MVKSSWVDRKLRDFRAGIESAISFLKRVFGLARRIWKGAPGLGTRRGPSARRRAAASRSRHRRTTPRPPRPENAASSAALAAVFAKTRCFRTDTRLGVSQPGTRR